MTFGRLIYGLILVGMVLMPFSTAPRGTEGGFTLFSLPGGFGVVHFGLPFLVAGVGVAAVAALSRRRSSHEHLEVPAVVGILYFLCLLGFTFLAPDVPVSGVRTAVNFIGLGVFLTVFHIASIHDQEHIELLIKLARGTVLSGVVLSGYFLINFAFEGLGHTQTELFSERYVGGIMALPWAASNTIAAVLLFPFVMTFALFEIDHHRKFFGFSAGIMLAAIAMTLSRNSLACLALFAAGYTALITRHRFQVVLVFAGILAAVFGWLIDKETIEYVLDTRLRDVDELMSLNRRFDLWAFFFEHIRDHPFDPVGYYGALGAFELTPHNWFLCTYVEMGPLGVLTGVAFLGVAVFRCLKWVRSSARISLRVSRVLLLGLTVIFLNLQAEDPQFTQPYIIYFWIFMGWLFACLSPSTMRALASRGKAGARIPAPRLIRGVKPLRA